MVYTNILLLLSILEINLPKKVKCMCKKKNLCVYEWNIVLKLYY